MKRLLVISFYYPPIMSAGSVRIGKLVKYLPEYGWEPIVLTVAPKPNIAQGIPNEADETRIVRTRYRDPVGLFSRPPSVHGCEPSSVSGPKSSKGSTLVFLREWIKKVSPFTIQRMPDRMLGWYPYAIQAGKRVMEWDSIDAIFSSHPSPVSHLIAAKLSREFRVPWVADYRDLWTGSTLRPYPKWLEALESKYERKILKNAAFLTTVSETLKGYLENLHAKSVEIIYNGFDPEDFEKEAARGKPGVFTLVYSGTLYTSRQSPVPLFEALRHLMEEGIVTKDKFQVRFIGVQEPPFRELVDTYGLDDLVSSEPFQPYKENVATLKGAGALLFFSWNEGEMEGNPTSKIFQYVGAGRPILVVGGGNRFAVDFIERTGTGKVGRDSKEIRYIISRWLEAVSRDGRIPYLPNREVIKPYNRRVQAGQLAAVLGRVTS